MKEIDYVVRDERIMPINPETATVDEYSRFPQSVLLPLEIMEGLPLSSNTTTKAKIDVNGLFSLYHRMAGISRCANVIHEDICREWNLHITAIPNTVSSLRKDDPDRIWIRNEDKFYSLVEDVFEAANNGRAVIVGVPSGDEFEHLAYYMKRNCKSHGLKGINQIRPFIQYDDVVKRVKDAGKAGTITLLQGNSTRGLDIIPDQECLENGGLLVIAASHFNNAVMDEQLRSIVGRHGEAGETVTYLSMEDPSVKAFISEENLNRLDTGARIESKMLTKTFQNSLHKLETIDRKNSRISYAYQNVLQEERKQLYEDRERILAGDGVEELLKTFIGNYVQDVLNGYGKDIDLSDVCKTIEDGLAIKGFEVSQSAEMSVSSMNTILQEALLKCVNQRLDVFNNGRKELIKQVMLRTIDNTWKEHMMALKGLYDAEMSYADLEKYLPQYKQTASSMYESMLYQIEEKTISKILHTKPAQKRTETKPAAKRIYPNDPCPCGSGKKYKECHGAMEYNKMQENLGELQKLMLANSKSSG